MNISETDKTILTSAVKTAGERALRTQPHMSSYTITKRGDFDFGITTDLDSEQYLFEGLKKLSFKHRIVSEEAGKIGAEDASYVIYVDPLDGTVNYAEGIPTFCISVSVYTKDQQPVFSVISNPSADELIVVDGDVLYVNGRVIPNYRSPKIPFINMEWFGAEKYEVYTHRLREKGLRCRVMGSGVLSLVYTALGRGNICLLLDNKPWDIAGGLHACQSRGLRIKTFSEKKLNLTLEKQSLIVFPQEFYEEVKFLL